MRVYLEFGPEEIRSFKIAAQAEDQYEVLSEMFKFLRQKTKYGMDSEEKMRAFEEVREEFNTLLYENNINLDL